MTGEGVDLVKSSLSFTLAANIENLTVTGTAALNGTGNGLANTLIGNGANNVLRGRDGKDKLVGNAGNDLLIGGLDPDTMTGGGGADRFKFVTSGEGLDRITDLASGTDKIQVVSGNFGGLPVGVLTAANFRFAGQALPAAAVFIYDVSAGALTFDRDGRGTAAKAQLLATLVGTKDPLSTDIVVVAA